MDWIQGRHVEESGSDRWAGRHGGGPRRLAGGATWGPDGSIILASENVTTGLQRVSASSGQAEVLTRPDPAQGEADHLWPEMLPDGRSVLFTITALTGGLEAAQVAMLDLQTGERQVLLRGGSHAHYVPSGHLVYGQAGSLQAVAFDLARRESGTPVTVVPDVLISSQGAVHAVVARDGTLAHLSVGGAGGPRALVWVDRLGSETSIGVPPRPYFLPGCRPMARASLFLPTIRNPTSGSGISAARRSPEPRRPRAEMSFRCGRLTVVA